MLISRRAERAGCQLTHGVGIFLRSHALKTDALATLNGAWFMWQA